MNLHTKKNINAILFFANMSGDTINRLKLMKLLWFADRIHLNKHGRLILKDNYNALTHGPVPSATMNYSKRNIENSFEIHGHDIRAVNTFDPQYFSKSDLEVLNQIWEIFGDFDRFRLRDLSHQFPEWLRFEKDINDKSQPDSYPIVMEDLFALPNYDKIAPYFPDKARLEKFKTIASVAHVDDSKSNFRAYTAIQSSLDESCP